MPEEEKRTGSGSSVGKEKAIARDRKRFSEDGNEVRSYWEKMIEINAEKLKDFKPMTTTEIVRDVEDLLCRESVDKFRTRPGEFFRRLKELEDKICFSFALKSDFDGMRLYAGYLMKRFRTEIDFEEADEFYTHQKILPAKESVKEKIEENLRSRKLKYFDGRGFVNTERVDGVRPKKAFAIAVARDMRNFDLESLLAGYEKHREMRFGKLRRFKDLSREEIELLADSLHSVESLEKRFFGDDTKYFSDLEAAEKKIFYSFLKRGEYIQIPGFLGPLKDSITKVTDLYALGAFVSMLGEMKSLIEDPIKNAASFTTKSKSMVDLLKNPTDNNIRNVEQFFSDDSALEEVLKPFKSEKLEKIFERNARVINYLGMVDHAVRGGYTGEDVSALHTKITDAIQDFVLDLEKSGLKPAGAADVTKFFCPDKKIGISEELSPEYCILVPYKIALRVSIEHLRCLDEVRKFRSAMRKRYYIF